MSKKIVYEGPHQKITVIDLNIGFTRNQPREMSDEQADKLLADSPSIFREIPEEAAPETAPAEEVSDAASFSEEE